MVVDFLRHGVGGSGWRTTYGVAGSELSVGVRTLPHSIPRAGLGHPGVTDEKPHLDP